MKLMFGNHVLENDKDFGSYRIDENDFVAIMVSGANLEFLHQVLRDQRGYNSMLEKIDCDFAGASSRLELERMQLDLDNYLPNNVLSLTDKAPMAASVEGRVPLLDHRLVEFAYSLPSEINLHKGVEKGLFKKVLESYLPQSVLTRGKEGFSAPMGKWSEKIALEVNNEMRSLHPLLAQIINAEVVERWCSDTRKRQFASESLYAIFMLSRWLRAHC